MKKQNRWEILFVIIAFITTFYIVTTSDFFGKKFSIEVGQIATETIYAPFQVENEMAMERKSKQVELTVPPVYKMNDKIQELGVANIELLFTYANTIKSTSIAEQFNVSPISLLQNKSPIPLYEDEYKTLMGLSIERLALMEESIMNLFTELLSVGVKEDESKALEVRNALEKTDLNVVEQKVAYEILTSQIKPNIIMDEVATEEARRIARESVEPIYVLQGEMIVAQGSRITEEVYQILSKVGFLDEEDESNAIQFFGLLMFMLLMVLFLSRYFNEHKVLGQLKFRQTSLIFIVYMLSLVIVRLFMPLEVIYIPLSIGAMLMAILIKKEIAIIMHLILVIISAIACKGDIIFILYVLMTGVIGIMIVASMQQRKQTMKCALLVGALHMLIYISLNLVVGVDIEPRLLIRGGQAFAVGLVEVVLVVGSLPLWEAAFGFITPIQLLELTNPNQPVLKRLLIEATGTYYHSLLVANLAEAAASDIGANTLLTRVGGYYHDIGKLQSSNYFKENQVRDNPHDYMDPKSSCDIILSHVTSGVEIAETYKLPKCVKDMIRQHHGTGIIQFFYVKAKEMDEEVLLKDFQYPGPKPQTREAALIMLADVVEATVRAMQHKIGTEVSVEDVVRKMVKQKLDEGQLDECPLYISDIEKIIHSFTHMLKGMYHERIEYPEKKG
ncbi:MAG: HD family phosphohydrolase [Cellulosilyticaceae bacterium]